MNISASRARGRSGLAAWVCGPVLVLIGLLLVVRELPFPECGEGGGASDGEMTLFYVLVAIGIVGCLAAAAASLVALWHRASTAPRWSRLLLASPALFIAAIGVLALAGVDSLVRAGLLAGAVATAVALATLLVAWTLGRGVDQVGILLPVYLLGAGLLCYPALGVLVAVGQSGLGC